MRNWPRRLPLIALGALGALIALILAGTYIYRESVLVDESGSGPGGETTEVFTVNGDWDLRWSYDCSASLGIQYPMVAQCDFLLAVKRRLAWQGRYGGMGRRVAGAGGAGWPMGKRHARHAHIG